jgi:hypothetical protein
LRPGWWSITGSLCANQGGGSAAHATRRAGQPSRGARRGSWPGLGGGITPRTIVRVVALCVTISASRSASKMATARRARGGESIEVCIAPGRATSRLHADRKLHMDPITSFGEWLRRRRKALGLTQAELADQAGCVTGTIRSIEADARRPSRQLAERLLWPRCCS